MQAAMHLCVIFNPTARGEKATLFREHLGALTRQCVFRPTTGPGAASLLAAQAVREGFDFIVAAGGDGTVNEVLNGIASVPEGLARVRFGVLPLGTINVFARELGIPARFDAAWQVIERRRELTLDIGLAEFGRPDAPQKRYFAQMAGAGWDARAIALVTWELKKKLGPLAYVLAGARALRGTQPEMTVTDGTTTLTGPVALIGNGRFYGGSWQFFPHADLRDGLLEVTVFRRWNWFVVARSCVGVLMNRIYTTGGALHFRAPSVQITSAAPLPFHVEAENAGELPARFSVLRQALRMVVP